MSMAEEKKKKTRGRRAYLDDFHQSVNGEYIYTGQTHPWKSPRGSSLAKLWLCEAAAFLTAVVGGCIPHTGMEHRPWALAPYVLMLLSAGVQGWFLYKLTDGGNPVREYVWRSAVKRLPVLGMVTGGLAVLAIILEIANIYASGFTGTMPFAMLLAVLELVCGGASLLLNRIMKKLEWG